MTKYMPRFGRFISERLIKFGQSVDNRLRGTSYSNLRPSDHSECEPTVDDSLDESSEYDDTESTGSNDGHPEVAVVEFGSNKGLAEEFTFSRKQDYPFEEKEIDQRQIKVEARPLETIRPTKARTVSQHKRMKVDPLTDGQKRKLSDDSSDDERDNFRMETSDYFSHDVIEPISDTKPSMLRTKSAPNVSKTGKVTFNIGSVEELIVENNTITPGTKGDINSSDELEKRVKERTQMMLNGQKVEGVETEAFKKMKRKTQCSPKLAIMLGKGSNFNARKFLKDHRDYYPDNERCTNLYILDHPDEWTAVRTDVKGVVAILIDDQRFEDWKRKIKCEILPTLQEKENIKVVVSCPKSPMMTPSIEGFDRDARLDKFVVDVSNTRLSPEVRKRLVWHEMDRYGICVCDTKGHHTDHARCISKNQFSYIVNNTGNLYFTQRVADLFYRFTEKNIDSLDEPYPAFVKMMKELEPRGKLALLMLTAFESNLKLADIESFRAKRSTRDKDFRHSNADMREMKMKAEVVKVATKYAKANNLNSDMWDIIETSLRQMDGWLVNESEGAYHFDGKAMQYSFLLSEVIPTETIMRICDDWFLYGRVVPQPLANEFPIAVYVGSTQVNVKAALHRRFLDLINDKEVRKVWSHILMAERWFCEGFLEFLKETTGVLSTFILEKDRAEKYNALVYGVEREFRIQMKDQPANLTELILFHKSYPKWQKRPSYIKSKDDQEAAALKHAIELQRKSTVKALLQICIHVTGDLLLMATETRNFELVHELLKTNREQDRFTFKEKCQALRRSLELYGEDDGDENEKQIFKFLASIGSVNYTIKDIDSLIIFATKRRNMKMLTLLTTCHLLEDATNTVSSTYATPVTDVENITLSSEKIDVNLVTRKGETALAIAVKQKYHEIVDFLLQNGAEQRRLTRSNMELPVMIAIKQDDCQSLKLLMENDSDIVNIKSIEGKYPIHEAVREQLDCMDTLLSSNTLKINAQDSQNETALHKAVAYGRNGIVERLLKAGANITVSDIDKNTPLKVAIDMNNRYAAELILKTAKARGMPADKRILFDALRQNDQGLLRTLFQCGYDINCEHNIHGTPLMFAIQQRNYDLMRFVLKHRADPERRQNGKPPIHAVRRRKDIDLLGILLGFGAKIDAADQTGDTLLHLAMSNGNHELAEDIIRHDKEGVLVDKPNYRGEMPLHIACKRGDEDGVRVLLRHGATRGVFNKDGRTPEMVAQEMLRIQGKRRGENYRNVLKTLCSIW